MFEDDVIKLKKEQFVEAESVAYLIKDELKRKLAFANTCCLFAFKNYIEKNKYKYAPITNINLFRVPAVAERFGISDLYLGDIRIDVRVSLDGKVFPVPKTQIKESLAADYYVVYKGTKNPLKCAGVGYISKEKLVFGSQDDDYYYISVDILEPIEKFKDEISDFKKEERTFFETEHRLSKENIVSFLDGDLDNVKSLDLIKHLLVCKDCRKLFVEYSFLEDVLTAVNHYPDLKENLNNDITKKENPSNEEIKIEEENQETLLPTENETLNVKENETILSINPTENISPIDEEIEPIYPYELEENIVNTTQQENMELDNIDIQDNEIELSNDMPEIQNEEIDIQDNQVELSNDMPEIQNEEIDIQDNQVELSNDVPEIQNEEIDIQDNQVETQTLPEENPKGKNEYSEGLVYEDDISHEEDEDSSQSDIVPEISVPIKEVETPTDEYTIMETNDSTEIITDDSDDVDLKSFLLDDINIQDTNTDNTNIETNLNINDSQPVVFEDNLADNSVIRDNTDDNEETVSLDDIFSNEKRIEIQASEVENIKNDEELKNILGDIDDTDTQENSLGWNEIFNENADTAQDTAEMPDYQENTSSLDETSDIGEIETLYEMNNSANEENNIQQKIEHAAEQEKKPVNATIIIAFVIILLAVVVAGGFFAFSSNFSNKTKDNIGNKTAQTTPDYTQGDMDRIMTDAFSENSSARLEIKKMSWDKNKSASMTKELKEYLNASASAVWDNLDGVLLSVQGYEVNAPSKIAISVGKNGDVKNIKIAQSCGSKEVDSVILKSVKDVLASMPPAKYSVKGENLNLTLVVNF